MIRLKFLTINLWIWKNFCKNWENGNKKKGRKVETRKKMRVLLRKFNIRMTEIIKKKKNTRRILKEIIFKNIFQNWRQEFSDWKRSITVNKKQLTARHTIKKSESTRDKEKILWSSREKKVDHLQRDKKRDSIRHLHHNNPRKQWCKIF